MEEEAFFAEPVTGWRVWRAKKIDGDLRLISMNATPWLPNEWLIARCRKNRSHKTPASKCACGIYAVNSFENLQGLGLISPGVVFGEVWLAGEIIEATTGYRAERASPKHLYVSYRDYELAKALKEAAYDIPVGLKNPYEGQDWRRRGNRQRKT